MELAGTHTDEPPGELDEMLENPPLLTGSRHSRR